MCLEGNEKNIVSYFTYTGLPWSWLISDSSWEQGGSSRENKAGLTFHSGKVQKLAFA